MNSSEKIVLVIEDDAETVVLMRLLLRRRRLKVVSMLPGENCMASIEEIRPDLVLLDIMMPGMDGWEIYQQMKASSALRETPIVVITVRSQETARMDGQAFDDVAGYMRKPFNPRSFLNMVDSLLKDESAGTPAILPSPLSGRIEKE